MRITPANFERIVRECVASFWDNPVSVTRERNVIYIEHPKSVNSILMVSAYPELPADLPRVFIQYGGEINNPEGAVFDRELTYRRDLTGALFEFDADVLAWID